MSTTKNIKPKAAAAVKPVTAPKPATSQPKIVGAKPAPFQPKQNLAKPTIAASVGHKKTPMTPEALTRMQVAITKREGSTPKKSHVAKLQSALDKSRKP